ncbi:MAG: hypothetical protein JSW14_03850 [Candidatus Bathyarchaeum sp.]|nr:MAG: hypothetical protein JSW14_03850 [Candidatus Bathyarchaeum sp.]
MTEANDEEIKSKKSKPGFSGGSRESLIKSVKTPLGFFVLVVLIVEAIMGITVSFSSGLDRTILIVGMIGLIFLLVAVVTGMAIYRPMSLYGKSVSDIKEIESSNKSISKVKMVSKPKVLCAVPLYGRELKNLEMFKSDVKIISQFFKDVTTEEELTTDKLHSLLANNNFNILHLVVCVRTKGEIILSPHVPLTSEGFEKLLAVSRPDLLIMAWCDSIHIAPMLAGKINMISIVGKIYDSQFLSWEKQFYELLSKGHPLSSAFEISRAVSQIPAVLIMKNDIIFKKT